MEMSLEAQHAYNVGFTALLITIMISMVMFGMLFYFLKKYKKERDCAYFILGTIYMFDVAARKITQVQADISSSKIDSYKQQADTSQEIKKVLITYSKIIANKNVN